jgi:hypothetical protein
VQHDDEPASSASRFDVYQPQRPYVSLDNYINGVLGCCQRRQHGMHVRARLLIRYGPQQFQVIVDSAYKPAQAANAAAAMCMVQELCAECSISAVQASRSATVTWWAGCSWECSMCRAQRTFPLVMHQEHLLKRG